ncbi:MAG: putative Orn/DAP/Arg decarboxylase, partial [Rhizobacter sp.]|nr:putative Orn/DAP/Arg decarboxylase [Rhizobacter sp.]
YVRTQLPPDVHLHYSIKANPMPALVQHLTGQVNGFDLASAGELRVALDAGMSPEKISIAGPGKSRQDIRAAVACGVTVNIESMTQLDTVAEAGAQLGVRPRVGVRVNPHFEAKLRGVTMAGGPRQFGLDTDQIPALMKGIGATQVKFCGFHVFWGSQCLDAATIACAQRETSELVVRLATEVHEPFEFVNFGGGFGIPYFSNEQPLDVAHIGQSMHEWLGAWRQQLPGVKVVVELGRYLVGEAGIYVCRVVDRKVSRGRTYLVTDGGLHHHLAASGNFGQFIPRNYPVVIGNRLHAAAEEKVHVVGCLCTPLDRIADDVTLPRAEIGDFIVVFQSGAYGRTASPNEFLSHPPPFEMLV